jgi:hypothetical protein
MKLFLKFSALTIATIGLLISLADALGWIPNPRAKLADQIMTLGNDLLPLDTENVDGFLRYFLKKKYEAYQQKADEMAGIAIEDLRMNASVMGTVYLQHKNGGRHQLCSFQQLREWTDSGKLPFWIGWCIAVAGLVCAWLIEVIDARILHKPRFCPSKELEPVDGEATEANEEYEEQKSSKQAMDQDELMQAVRKAELRDDLRQIDEQTLESRVDRYTEIHHQGIIDNHYFATASSQCIHLYRDGYFIGAVMMSHAINEGIIRLIAERNSINLHGGNGSTKTIEDLILELEKKNIISKACADASTKIWKSFRADIHHMNPTIGKIPFQKLAKQNLKCLSTIEGEIFGHDFKDGAIAPHQPKYWDIKSDGTADVFLRLE